MALVPSPLIAIPLKPFDHAKGRLDGVLPGRGRALLGQAMAERTIGIAKAAGAELLVLAADTGIMAWAESLEVPVVDDGGQGLDRAAEIAAEHATSAGWIVCHADLPLLTVTDLARAMDTVAAGRAVIAPSSDGGTSLIGSREGRIKFGYGPGSFARHLARLAHRRPSVIVSLGLCLDIDTPEDLRACLGHPRGRWLRELLEGYADHL